MLFRSLQVFRRIAVLAETYPVSIGKAVSVTVVASATAGSPVIGVSDDQAKPTKELVVSSGRSTCGVGGLTTIG